jgi:hypothetical protein
MLLRTVCPALRAAVVLGLLALSGSAAAQPRENIEKAKGYFYAGEQAYRIGQYRTAISAYEEAYRLYPVPAFLFNTAQAHRKQYDLDGDLAQLKLAKDLYERFLREDPTSRNQARAQELLAEVEASIGKHVPRAAPSAPAPPDTQAILTSTPPGAEVALDTRDFSLGGRTPYIRKVEPGHHVAWFRSPGYQSAEVSFEAEEGKLVAAQALLKEIPAQLALTSSPAGAAVTIDGIPVGVTPLWGRQLPAGKHLVVVTTRGRYAWARTIDLERAEKRTLSAGLEVTRRRRVAWTGLLAAAALAVAGTVTGLLALSARDDLDAYRGEVAPGADLTRYNELADSASHRALATDVLLGLAAACAGTSAWLFYFDRPIVPPAARPDLVGVGVAARF